MSSPYQRAFVWHRVRGVGESGWPKRSGHVSVPGVREGTIVVFGGGPDDCVSNDVFEIDTVHKTIEHKLFSPAIEMPTSRDRHTCVTHNGSMYMFGGEDASATMRCDLWRLDLTSFTWEEIELIDGPTPRRGHSATMVGDIMFIFGGLDDEGTTLNDVWCTDLTPGSRWEYVYCEDEVFADEPDLNTPLPRRGHTAAAFKHNVFVFGGCPSTELLLNDFYRLDLDVCRWYPLECVSPPTPRVGHAAVVEANEMFIFGGNITQDTSRAANDLFVVNLDEAIETGRAIFRIILATPDPLPGMPSSYDYDDDDEATAAMPLSPNAPPSERSYTTATVLDGVMYVLGGWSNNHSVSDLHMIKLGERTLKGSIRRQLLQSGWPWKDNTPERAEPPRGGKN
eukprot:PhM_4_TR6199/c0_g1_i1/m.43395